MSKFEDDDYRRPLRPMPGVPGCWFTLALLSIVLLCTLLSWSAVGAQTASPTPDPDERAIEPALALINDAGIALGLTDSGAGTHYPTDAQIARFANAVQNAMSIVEGLNLEGCKAPWRDTLMAGLEHLQFGAQALRTHADPLIKLFINVGQFLVYNSAPLIHDMSGCS